MQFGADTRAIELYTVSVVKPEIASPPAHDLTIFGFIALLADYEVRLKIGGRPSQFVNHIPDIRNAEFEDNHPHQSEDQLLVSIDYILHKELDEESPYWYLTSAPMLVKFTPRLWMKLSALFTFSTFWILSLGL